MKIDLSRIGAALGALILFALAAFAQNETITAAAGDKYVISAKAGGINVVAGAVGVVRKQGKSGVLLKGDTLAIGDRVSTGADGKVEILLNPGSYLRIGGNSAFEFRTTSLDDLKLRLDSGSAILEVFADNDFTVTVGTPKTKFTLMETGIYRVDVDADGSSKLEVWKGLARVDGPNTPELKGGRMATVSGTGTAVAKFDRDDKDSFELWSKSRAKELSKISNNLKSRDLRTTLMSSFLGRSWNMYDSFGLWVYSPFGSSYCFLPFGQGWYSPYGYGFGRSIWYYDLPPIVYYPPSGAGASSGGRRGTGGRRPVDSGTGASSAASERPVPPFARMRGSDTGRRSVVDTSNVRIDSPMRSTPVYVEPTISAPSRNSGSSGGGRVPVRP